MENPVSYARHHKYVMGMLSIIIVLAFAIGLRVLNRGGEATQQINEKRVSLVEAGEYLKDNGVVNATGLIESIQGADLRSQASGAVTRINVKLGQRVSRGQLLVSLQNTEVVAALAQAQAGLKAQQARLDEMRRGARTEQLELEESRVIAARQALQDTTASQDAIVRSAHSALLNTGLAIIPGENNVSNARLALSGSYNLDKEGQYIITFPSGGEKPPYTVNGIENSNGWVTRGSASPIADGGLYFTVSTEGDIYPGESWTIRIPNPQSLSYTATKNNYDAALTAREAAINGAQNALRAAENAYELTLAGASNEQIRAQEAAVDQAEAAVLAASAQLEKTVFRSPINGTVSALPVKVSELVSPGTLVASVVGRDGLQVRAYISEFDLPLIAQGSKVSINKTATGTITNISPSVDPNTKNIETIITVDDPNESKLVVGQNTTLEIGAAKKDAGGNIFSLPIQMVKISNQGSAVFTVNEESILVENPVKLGRVSGEFVEIIEGLKPDMKIVQTVYELKAGQKVIVQ